MNEFEVASRLVGLIVWDGPWLPSEREVNFGTPVLQGRRRDRERGRSATRSVGLFVLVATCECILRSVGGEDSEPSVGGDPSTWTTFHSLLLEQAVVSGNPPVCTGVDVVEDGLSFRIGDDVFLDLRYAGDDGAEQWRLVDTLEGCRYVLRLGPQGRRVVASEDPQAHPLRLAPEADVDG